MSVSDRVVFITGASRGIGAAAARAFAAGGARLALVARDGAACAALAGEIAEAGGQALGIGCDVADAAALGEAVAQAETALGPIDVLINNAAVIAPIGLIGATDPAAWRRLVDINLTGVFNGMHAVLPGMRARRCGTIITISSGAAHNALEGWSGYCASKAGAAMLTACAHLEAGGAGVRVMGLSPGTVATDMQREIRDSGVNAVSRLDWSAHIAPEIVAQALLWMCGPEADALRGTELSLRDPALRARMGIAS